MKKRLPLENELRHVLQITPNPNEPRQSFLKRLVLKADILEEDSWFSLSGNAHDWIRANSLAVSESQSISDFNAQNSYIENLSEPKILSTPKIDERQEQNYVEKLSIAEISGVEIIPPKVEVAIDHTRTPLKDMELRHIEAYSQKQLSQKKKRVRKTKNPNKKGRRMSAAALSCLIIWPDQHMACPEFCHRFLTDKRCETVSWLNAKEWWARWQQIFAIIKHFEKKGLPDGDTEEIELTGKGYTKAATKRPYNIKDYRRSKAYNLIEAAENSI